MKSTVLETATKEYLRWKAQLRHSVAYQNMNEWADVIIAKGGTLPDESTGVQKSDAAKSKKADNAGIAKYGEQKRRIRELTIECIAKNKGHAPVDTIYDYWLANGLKVTRERASAYLSEQKGVFISDRVKGWSIRNNEISSGSNAAKVTAGEVSPKGGAGVSPPSAVDDGIMPHHSHQSH